MDLTKWTNYEGVEVKGRALESLALTLVKAESEKEVIETLRKVDIWDNPKNWEFYGHNENNFATIGNQQSLPESAIVEKIINSVDALLMRECLRKRIDPESSDAPQNINEALQEFFGISQGSLWNASVSSRRELAQNISFVATGKKQNPCYSIIDKGEGQTPRKMPATFLSLSASNKLRIPFVQGKFNMGGTGVFQFSGHNNLQLIISKREPEIARNEKDDTGEYWGFTVVRREDPKQGRKSSAYTYLVIDGKIPMFKAKSLPILPGEYPIAYREPMEWGTFIKLFEYQMSGLKSPVVFDLYNRISLLLPKIALPVRFFERRSGYTGHTLETTMSGLSVRLREDSRDNLEDGFPSSSTITVSGEEMTCQIFAFKKGQSIKYRKDEGVIFTINGQTHGHIPTSIFGRKETGMAYLADSLLVTVDCTNFTGRNREDLFMNSRDRLRSGELKEQIERRIEELLNNHAGLRALREKRRRDEILNKIEDAKPLKEILEDILKNSPSISSLLIPGFKIKNPFDLRGVSSDTNFVGKEFPTYFRLLLDEIKQCPENTRFRVQYETDANNDYFERDMLPGKFELYLGEKRTDNILNLWNGIATLNVSLPDNAEVGALLCYKSIVNDETQFKPFEAEFQVRVLKKVQKYGSDSKERKKPPSDTEGHERAMPSMLALPHIIEIRKDEWKTQNFNEYSALRPKDTGEEGYDFYINMDNIYLLSEIKAKTDVDAKLLQERYKYALVLIGLALLKENKEKQPVNSEKDVSEEVFETTSKISPVILPMIDYLGELEIES